MAIDFVETILNREKVMCLMHSKKKRKAKSEGQQSLLTHRGRCSHLWLTAMKVSEEVPQSPVTVGGFRGPIFLCCI